MKRIYSKLQPDLLLHTLVYKSDLTDARLNISPDSEFLQLSGFIVNNGKTYRAHKHILCNKVVTMPQESWIVISGSVKVIHYDLDDTIISEEIINSGDATITFRGGHNYLCMEDNTVVYEIKVPQYTGQADDKVFI